MFLPNVLDESRLWKTCPVMSFGVWSFNNRNTAIIFKIFGKIIEKTGWSKRISIVTPPRTPRISRLKSQILKPTFLS